jgi:hypothetical protein
VAYEVGETITAPLAVIAVPPEPLVLQSSVLQNPSAPRYADVVVVASRGLNAPPQVKVVRGADSTALAMSPIGTGSVVFGGPYEFTGSGAHIIRTSGQSQDGVDTMVVRTFLAQEVAPGRTVSIMTPEGGAILTIGADLLVERTFFTADVEHPGAGESVYSFGPPRAFGAPLRVEIRYDPSSISNPARLTVYRREGTGWQPLPTQVFPGERLARAMAAVLGDFRIAENPDLGIDNLVPERDAIRAIRPNPFGRSAAIDVDLAEDGPLRVSIHNVLGQRVNTLAEGIWLAGKHSFIWEGSGDTGLRVASGVYFCRMEAGKHVETRRVILLPARP